MRPVSLLISIRNSEMAVCVCVGGQRDREADRETERGVGSGRRICRLGLCCRELEEARFSNGPNWYKEKDWRSVSTDPLGKAASRKSIPNSASCSSP